MFVRCSMRLDVEMGHHIESMPSPIRKAWSELLSVVEKLRLIQELVKSPDEWCSYYWVRRLPCSFSLEVVIVSFWDCSALSKPTFTKATTFFDAPNALRVSIKAHSEDIGLYVAERVRKSSKLQAIIRHCAEGPSLVDRLSDRIKQSSNGM